MSRAGAVMAAGAIGARRRKLGLAKPGGGITPTATAPKPIVLTKVLDLSPTTSNNPQGISLDGATLYVGANPPADGTLGNIRGVDFPAGTQTYTTGKVGFGHCQTIDVQDGLCYLATGSGLAVGDRGVKVWDLAGQKVLKTFPVSDWTDGGCAAIDRANQRLVLVRGGKSDTVTNSHTGYYCNLTTGALTAKGVVTMPVGAFTQGMAVQNGEIVIVVSFYGPGGSASLDDRTNALLYYDLNFVYKRRVDLPLTTEAEGITFDQATGDAYIASINPNRIMRIDNLGLAAA